MPRLTALKMDPNEIQIYSRRLASRRTRRYSTIAGNRLTLILMRILRQVLLAVTVLAAVVAIGASRHRIAPASAVNLETATFVGGCFWGLQETLRQIPGVIQTTAGYTGGTTPNPTYEMVAAGKTGHTEAVEVVFDPARLSYAELLADFLAARVPARLGRSTNSLHHPAIFYHNENQRQIAGRVKESISRPGKGDAPLIVDIKPATEFYPAEEYHQDYYRKNTAASTCSLE